MKNSLLELNIYHSDECDSSSDKSSFHIDEQLVSQSGYLRPTAYVCLIAYW